MLLKQFEFGARVASCGRLFHFRAMRMGGKFALVFLLESLGTVMKWRFPWILCAGPSSRVD